MIESLDAESIAPVAILALTSSLLVVWGSRLGQTILLAVQYGAAAWMTAVGIGPELGAAKAAAGLAACGVVWLSWPRSAAQPSESQPVFPRGYAFRVASVMLVLTAALGSAVGRGLNLSEVPRLAATSAVLMGGMGLLLLGLSEHPFDVGLGLLTLLTGFEIGYTRLEPSFALAAMMAGVHLGIALVIGVLIPRPEGASASEAAEP